MVAEGQHTVVVVVALVTYLTVQVPQETVRQIVQIVVVERILPIALFGIVGGGVRVVLTPLLPACTWLAVPSGGPVAHGALHRLHGSGTV